MATKMECPKCKRQVEVRADDGRFYYVHHTIKPGNTYSKNDYCKNGGKPASK